MKKIRVIIADDHPLMVMGVRDLLAKDANISIEAEVFTPTDLFNQLEKSLPDVVITDYTMPDDECYGDGIKFIQLLLRRFPEVKLIVLTMLSNPLIISSLYETGVQAVVLKKHNLNEINRALHMTSMGLQYYPPGFRKEMRPDHGGAVQERIKNLSPKEFEVLRLFSQGSTVGEVAEHLNRSIKTVSTQKTTAMRKLEVKTNQDLITFCMEHGLFLH